MLLAGRPWAGVCRATVGRYRAHTGKLRGAAASVGGATNNHLDEGSTVRNGHLWARRNSVSVNKVNLAGQARRPPSAWER